MAYAAVRHPPLKSARLLAALTSGLMLSACAQLGDSGKLDLTASAAPEAGAAAGPQSELEKATDYWGKEHAKQPRDLDTALSYASNLKAMGQKRKALAVLQQASQFHATDKRLASEYGRLALEFDQIAVAKKLLDVADDPTNPDWRIISARGTVLAKQGEYRAAMPYYERALTLAPDQPSVMSNLALAYTMTGETAKAEELLRRAAQNGGTPKVRQNLALVLGLQGKYDEAKEVAAQDLNPASASANSEYLRQIVKLDPKQTAQPEASIAQKDSAGGPALKPAIADAATPAATDPWRAQVAQSTDAPPTSKPSAP